jgi:hypothetical protein
MAGEPHDLQVSLIQHDGIGGPWYAYGVEAWAELADTLGRLPEHRDAPEAVAAYDGGGLIRIAVHLEVEMYAGDVEASCACAQGCIWRGRLADMWMWHGRLVCPPCHHEP